MGVIFSCQNTQKCLARFDNDTVYFGHGMQIWGSYTNGEVYDVDKKVIAVYCDNALSPKDKNVPPFVVKGNCICVGDAPYVSFQGNTEGACAAAYLYYRNQIAEGADKEYPASNKDSRASKNEDWVFSDLWKNINERTSTFVKIILLLALLAVGYSIYTLPRIIALLLEEDIGIVLLCAWGGAFLFGFRRNTYPQFKGMRYVFTWLWEYLIPYLHVLWIVVVIICAYAVFNGFFSFSYLAGVLYYLPNVAAALTIPLYLINLARSLYLLYKYKR